MDAFIYIALGLLGVLALCDLFVGVSNDAVNFLNSAVGSRTAPFWIIMAVACAGVLLGATFSSGMMEIAKTGVLVPERLTFAEVVIVFCAVMVTDVLILNTFNSFGLPTSTTVSIIFELLGGALAMACYKVWTTGAPFTDLGLYLNSGKALAMIMAILVSVVVAFFAGLITQYVLRLLFTFRYQKSYRWLGGLFGAAAVCAIFYFLVMKGLAGASFMRHEWIVWVDDNTKPILLTLFGSCFVVFQALILFWRVNIFPFIILSGTFALAFAFAGNDLVNFVGVPLAALDSFTIFSAHPGADPATFTMEGLRASMRTPTVFLAASGIVMCLTLCFSKKAHRVIRTSVNLASSSRGGKEQFGSSLPARVIVRGALKFHELVEELIPRSVMRTLVLRFRKPRVPKGQTELPFDEVRASVNLVLASALIASATSLQLPLSTTYVTFMVAMGSSLADGAWDRESAVYRISGVLTVISGWFLTAFTAATACAVVCALFIWLGEPAMILAMLAAFFVIVRSNFFSKETKEEEESFRRLDRGDQRLVHDLLMVSVDRYLDETLTLFAEGLDAFLDEDHIRLKRLKNRSVALFDEISFRRGEYYSMALEGGGSKADRDARTFYYRAFTNMKEVGHSLRDQLGVTENYVANSHSPFKGVMRENMQILSNDLKGLRDHHFMPAQCSRILRLIDEAQKNFLGLIGEEKVSLRKSELYLGYLLFSREMLNRYMMVKLLQSELSASASNEAAPSAA